MIDCSESLRHIGIIMDGNGRWATSRSLPRSAGHLEGLKRAKQLIAAAVARKIGYLTLYTFSTENWKRPEPEIEYLFGLISKYIRKEYPFYTANNIRIRFCGDLDALPEKILAKLRNAMRYTASNTGLQVVLALNYGGRDEIIRTVRRISAAFPTQSLQMLDERQFRNFTDNPDIPDPELIVRTAGELRLSNFLLWQGAYSELYFSDTLWPDWDEDHLDRAIADYLGRTRRFGGIVH